MATELDRLVVKIEADIAGMEATLKKVVANNQAAAKKVEDAWKSKGLGAAFSKGFKDLEDSAGDAARSIPGLGKALDALGPGGLAAAAGIGAFIEALAKAKDAVEWSAELSKQAEALHISTDALQQYQVALRMAGGDQAQVATSLQSFSEILGKAAAGMPRALKVFQELFGKSFTKEDVAKLGDAQEALVKVNAAIQGLSQTQKEAILSQFGISGMKEILELPPEKMRELGDAAARSGEIMDSAVVARGREINEHLEHAFKVIDKDWKTALTELAPILEVLVGKFADIATSVANTVAGLRGVRNLDIDALKARRQVFIDAHLPSNDPRIAKLDQLIAGREAINAGQKIAEDWAASAAQKPGRTLQYPGKATKIEDVTVAETKAATDAYLASLKDLNTAQAALATTIEARTNYELDALHAETAKKIADLDAEEAKIRKAATDGKINREQAEQIRDLEAAKANEALVATDKETLIIQKAATEKLSARNDHLDAVAKLDADTLSAQGAHLSALAALATSSKERAALDARALKLQQQAERDLLDAQIARASSELEMAKVNHGTAVAIQAAQDKLDALQQTRAGLPQKQADAATAQSIADLSPVQKYQREIANLSDTMETAGVDAAKSLASGLADAIVNAKSLGDVASNVFRQLISQLLSAVLEKSVIGPIVAALPAFAGGTSSSPAGWAMVGEEGPEVVRLPGGSQVIPTSSLRNVGMGRPSGTGPTIIFDNRGAVIWEQAAREMMSYADRAALTAGVGAAQFSRSATPSDLARSASRRLG